MRILRSHVAGLTGFPSGVWFTTWACRAWPEPPGHAEAHALREARAVHRLLFSGEASRPY